MVYNINYKFQPALQIQKNSSRTFEFEIRDNFNNVVDLTSSTGTLKVYLEKSGTNDNPVISKSITLTEAVKGLCEVSLIDTDTNIDPNVYKYRLEFDYGSNDVRIFGDGIFDLLGDDTSRIMQIKRNKGLAFDYYVLDNALNDARQKVKDYCFQPIEIIQRQSKSEIKIDNYVADSNFDGVVNEDDIEIIEYQNESPYGINDLSGNISTFTANHPIGKSILVMDADYPSDDTYVVKINYHKTTDKYDKIKYSLLKLEELYVMVYLFENLEPYKLQRGVTDKTIGNQTISFNQNAIRDYQKDLQRQITRETINIKPIVNSSVQINKGY